MTSDAPASGFDVLRGAAHLLRTPLGVVLGTASTLRDYDARFTPEQRVKYLNEVVRASEEMKAALDGLSLLARLMEGTLPVNMTVMPVITVAADCETALKVAWPGWAPVVRSSGDGSALADPQRLGQVMEALGRAVAPTDGTVLEVWAGGGRSVRLGPVVAGHSQGLLTEVLCSPHAAIVVHEVIAGPAGWPLLLARWLCDAQQARVQVEATRDDGSCLIQIDLASAGR